MRNLFVIMMLASTLIFLGCANKQSFEGPVLETKTSPEEIEHGVDRELSKFFLAYYEEPSKDDLTANMFLYTIFNGATYQYDYASGEYSWLRKGAEKSIKPGESFSVLMDPRQKFNPEMFFFFSMDEKGNLRIYHYDFPSLRLATKLQTMSADSLKQTVWNGFAQIMSDVLTPSHLRACFTMIDTYPVVVIDLFPTRWYSPAGCWEKYSTR